MTGELGPVQPIDLVEQAGSTGVDDHCFPRISNAKKPDMQAAAKARRGKDLGEDEATRLGLALSRWTLIYSVSSQQKPQPQGKG